MSDYYRNNKNNSSSSESTITLKEQKDEKKYYISSRKSFPSKKHYSDYVPYDEYKERPYKEKYRDDYRNNYNYKERERYSPYYNKYDRYEKYDSKYERRSRSRHSSKRYNSHSKRKYSRNSHSRSRRSRSREYHESRSNHNYNHNIYNKNYSRDKEPIYNNKTKKRDYKEERRRLRERSRSNSVLRMMKIKNIENSKGTLYQRNYSRPHENNDPRKPHLYWDGYQWIARPHSTEEIIKLNERKVQLVNMPLNYNLKKKQIKKYILAQMVEKGVVSSKLYYDELEKKIEDIELNKDTNIVLLTMENLELAKSMILLDGIILLGHTIRVSLYSEVKDLSMDNLQKASAMANSANVTAKSAAISFAAFESIFRSDVGKKDIILNVENDNSVRNKDTSNVIKIMGLLGREDDNYENKLSEREYKELYDDMNEAFSQYGKIQKILVIGEKEEKLGAEIGSVFIQYSNVKGAETAFQNMSNKKYKGNEISIVFVPLYVFINDIVLNEDKEKNEQNKIDEKEFDNEIKF